jgi:hypothetical protein
LGTAVTVAEYDPVDEELMAATRKTYEVPFVNHETTRVVDVDHVLEDDVDQDTPPLDEYSIL